MAPMAATSVYNRAVSAATTVVSTANLEEVKETSVYVSQRSLRVLRGIALDKKKQVLVLLGFFALAWTVSVSSLNGRGAAYNQLKARHRPSEIAGVEEACSYREHELHENVTSLPRLLCSNRLACGVDQQPTIEKCDEYWRRTLQRGHIESIELPRIGRLDKELKTIDDVVDFLEDQLMADARMRIPARMSMGHESVMLPLPWNSKSVIQRKGYYTPDGRFVAYRVQGVGGGNTYAYHCDRILGFNRVLPSSMRLMSAQGLEGLLVQSLRNKARAMRTSSAQREAKEAIGRRSAGLAKLASKEFKFNETHVLVEMVSAVPASVESHIVDVDSKSPLVGVTDSTFWDYVTMQTATDLPDTPQGRTFAKIAMDVVDMQIFDYIVGNDNRRFPSIKFLGEDRSFLLFPDNLAAGSGVDPSPEIKMPSNFQTPNLYLGALGCKFRHSTIARLVKIRDDEKRLSTKVRDSIASMDPVYVEQYEALAHGWLMATLQHVDLISNTDLDENLNKVVDYVEGCVQQFGNARVYVNA